MAIKDLYPEISPALNLDFARVKALDPKITFSRASSATYYGTQTAKAEENLLTYSQEFDNAAWTKTRITVTGDNQTAPDGTTTADTITLTAETGIKALVQVYPTLTGGRMASVFAKGGTHNFLQIYTNGDTAPWANFDLTSGAVGSTGSNQTASIIDVGNGWYRCVLFTSSTSANNFSIAFVSSSTAARFESWTATGTETVFLWGAQLENRDSVTAYTPTTTQPITNYIPVLETASANVARFDHDPLTFESLGLLVEESRTNLFLQSENLGTTWGLGSGGTLVTNSWVTPAGTLTGDIFTMASDSTSPNQIVTVLSSTTYTLSFYFSKNFTTAAFFRLRFSIDGGSSSIWFDTQNLTFGSTGGGISGGIITAEGNNVYRLSVQMTYNSTSGGSRSIAIAGVTANNGTTADTGKNIAIWGMQYEQGSFVTSYIKTEASQVTRSADSASMTGSNFSSWYRQDEGTFYAENSQFGTTLGFIFTASDGTINNRVAQFRNGATLSSRYVVSGSSFNPGDMTIAAQSLLKTALAVSVGSAVAVNNGSLSSVSSPSSVFVADRLGIGLDSSGGVPLNGHIRKLSYYNKRLSNTQLQALTS